MCVVDGLVIAGDAGPRTNVSCSTDGAGSLNGAGRWHVMRSRRSWADLQGRAVQLLKVPLAAMCLSLALPFAGCQARDLVVFGEPTLMNALQRVGAAWRERSGVRVNVFVAPSDLSFAQIHRGARCDLVFALVGSATDDAERQGIIRSKPTAPLLRNSLLLVARSGSASTIAPSDRTKLASFLKGKRLTIANPDRDPAGSHGLRWLQQLGLRSEHDKKLIVAESAAGVAQILAENMAQAGIVYATDVASRSDLVVFTTLHELDDAAIQYVVEEAMDPQSDTKFFLDFLGSPEAHAILRAAGLQVVGE
jgi:molybdenum ABC transporter molybdate-binding protein